MTWLTATGRLATQLRTLIMTPQGLTPADAGVPAAAYVAVLDLVRRVHGELELVAIPERANADSLDADEVQTWRQRFDTCAAEPIPDDLRHLAAARIDDVPGTAAGELWRTAAHTARHAEIEWEVSRRDSRPSGLGVEATLADLASLQWAASIAFVNATQALADLHPGNSPELSAMTIKAQGTAKNARYAILGLTDSTSSAGGRAHPDLHEHESSVAITDTTPDSLARGIRRLQHLIATAELMGPRVVAQIAGLHRVTTTHLGDAAARIGRDQRHHGLIQVGRVLHRHAAAFEISPPQVESLRTVDPVDDAQIAALRQATAIARAAEQAASTTPISIGSLLPSVSEVPGVTSQLAALTRSNIIGGRWLLPAESMSTPHRRKDQNAAKTEPVALDWRRTSAFDDIPMAAVLYYAAKQATALRQELPRATPRRAVDVLSHLASRPSRPGIIHPELRSL